MIINTHPTSNQLLCNKTRPTSLQSDSLGATEQKIPCFLFVLIQSKHSYPVKIIHFKITHSCCDWHRSMSRKTSTAGVKKNLLFAAPTAGRCKFRFFSPHRVVFRVRRTQPWTSLLTFCFQEKKVSGAWGKAPDISYGLFDQQKQLM